MYEIYMQRQGGESRIAFSYYIPIKKRKIGKYKNMSCQNRV